MEDVTQVAPLYLPSPTHNHPAELAILQRLRDEGDALVREYLEINTEDGLTYIARDKAKEIFAEYRSDPTLHNRHADAAASAIADAARRTLLLRPHGSQNAVLIITGCPASGKTASVRADGLGRIEIQHETILTSLGRASQLVEETIAARRLPVIRLHYTDDPRINLRRMIFRALEAGRTVPIRYMAETYLGVPAVISSLARQFGPRLQIRVINNSELPHQQVPHHNIERALYHVNRYTQTQALEAMHGELDKLTHSHTIPASILREARRA